MTSFNNQNNFPVCVCVDQIKWQSLRRCAQVLRFQLVTPRSMSKMFTCTHTHMVCGVVEWMLVRLFDTCRPTNRMFLIASKHCHHNNSFFILQAHQIRVVALMVWCFWNANSMRLDDWSHRNVLTFRILEFATFFILSKSLSMCCVVFIIIFTVATHERLTTMTRSI